MLHNLAEPLELAPSEVALNVYPAKDYLLDARVGSQA